MPCLMPIRVNQTSSKLWQDRCGLLLDGLTAPGAGGLPGAGGNAAAVAIERASERKSFSLPAKCRTRRRKLNKSLTNTEGFQRLARCIFKATLLTAEDIWFKCDLYLRFIPPINIWNICVDLRPFLKGKAGRFWRLSRSNNLKIQNDENSK